MYMYFQCFNYCYMSFVRAIDGTHVKIRTPSGPDAHQYINREGVPSINISVSYPLGFTINAVYTDYSIYCKFNISIQLLLECIRFVLVQWTSLKKSKNYDKCY